MQSVMNTMCFEAFFCHHRRKIYGLGKSPGCPLCSDLYPTELKTVTEVSLIVHTF